MDTEIDRIIKRLNDDYHGKVEMDSDGYYLLYMKDGKERLVELEAMTFEGALREADGLLFAEVLGS